MRDPLQMIELVSGKAGVFKGRQGYGTAFGEQSGSADKLHDVCRELVEQGYSYHGKDVMTRCVVVVVSVS
jgi:DNA-directed RNA polymerase III subunit RPC2